MSNAILQACLQNHLALSPAKTVTISGSNGSKFTICDLRCADCGCMEGGRSLDCGGAVRYRGSFPDDCLVGDIAPSKMRPSFRESVAGRALRSGAALFSPGLKLTVTEGRQRALLLQSCITMELELLPEWLMESTQPRRSALVVLFALCTVLAVALLCWHRIATEEKAQFQDRISQLSNACHEASLKLEEQKAVNSSLERELSAASTQWSEDNGISIDLVKPGVAWRVTMAESSQPDSRIAELQDERDSLSVKLDDLTATLAKLDLDMAATKQKLQASEGDRETLSLELKRIEVDRARLMSQFNNLASVRAQLRRLKAEQSVSRRLEWIRRGVYGRDKGAELLQKVLASASPASSSYDLNVEVHRDGTARSWPVAR